MSGNTVRQARRRLDRLSAVRVLLALAGLAAAGCSDSPTSATPTGIPATIALTFTVVNTGQPSTASIVATVRDSESLVVNGATVNFTTTSGFVTAKSVTTPDGVAVALLTADSGSAPTVTASAAADTGTVTASIVVRF
jgi:hypothetical protein